MWLKNEHQIDATPLTSACVLWINITGTLDAHISTQMWSIDAFQIINAIFAILVLFFKGSATHGGTKLFVTGCKGLKKKTVSLQASVTKALIKHEAVSSSDGSVRFLFTRWHRSLQRPQFELNEKKRGKEKKVSCSVSS